MHHLFQWHLCKLPRVHSLQYVCLLQRRLLPCQLRAQHRCLHPVPGWLLLQGGRHCVYCLPARDVLDCVRRQFELRLHSMRYRGLRQRPSVSMHSLPCRVHHSEHRHTISLRLQHVYSRDLLCHRGVWLLQHGHIHSNPQLYPVLQLYLRMVLRQRSVGVPGLPGRQVFLLCCCGCSSSPCASCDCQLSANIQPCYTCSGPVLLGLSRRVHVLNLRLHNNLLQ